jgi:hypothetical protein
MAPQPYDHQDLAPRFLVPLVVVPCQRSRREETDQTRDGYDTTRRNDGDNLTGEQVHGLPAHHRSREPYV